jgi:hypothetical protein
MRVDKACRCTRLAMALSVIVLACAGTGLTGRPGGGTDSGPAATDRQVAPPPRLLLDLARLLYGYDAAGLDLPPGAGQPPSGLSSAGTASAGAVGPGGVPAPNGRPPRLSRPCRVSQPDRSGPAGTMPVGLIVRCTW